MELFADNSLSANTNTYNPATREATGGTNVAYKTVNEAIANCLTGGTINIRAGTYRENGQVDVCYPIPRFMTLQAYNSEAVILTYAFAPYVELGEYGQIIKATAPVVLDGLTVVGTRDVGDSISQDLDVSVLLNDNIGAVTIKNCVFQKWGHCAIKFASPGGNVLIQDNDFQAGGFTTRDHHIYATGDYRTNTLTIDGNSFSGAPGWGIHLYSYVYGAVITGNIIEDNLGGILVTGDEHNITGNTIRNNSGSHGIDFFHYGLSNLVVTDNTFTNNVAYDLYLDASGGEGFTDCTIQETGTRNFE